MDLCRILIGIDVVGREYFDVEFVLIRFLSGKVVYFFVFFLSVFEIVILMSAILEGSI